MESLKSKQLLCLKKLSKGYIIANIILIVITAVSYLGDNIYKNNPKVRTMNTLIPLSVITQCLLTMIYLFIKYHLIDWNDKQKFKNVSTFLLISGFIIMISAISIGGGVFKFKICAKVFSVAFLIWGLTLATGNIYNPKIFKLK